MIYIHPIHCEISFKLLIDLGSLSMDHEQLAPPQKHPCRGIVKEDVTLGTRVAGTLRRRSEGSQGHSEDG